MFFARYEYQEKVSENLDDIAQVQQALLHLSIGDNAALLQEAVRCLQVNELVRPSLYCD